MLRHFEGSPDGPSRRSAFISLGALCMQHEECLDLIVTTFGYPNSYSLEEEVYISQYSYARLSDEHYDVIARYSPLVELGAGSGYIAQELCKRYPSTDIVCYDVKEHHTYNEQWSDDDKLRHRVLVGDESALAQHHNRTLLLIWPPMDCDMAANALRVFRGTRVIYVGEEDGGITANSQFFEMLSKNWKLIDKVEVNSHSYVRDYLMVFTKNPVNALNSTKPSKFTMGTVSPMLTEERRKIGNFRKLKKAGLCSIMEAEELLEQGMCVEAAVKLYYAAWCFDFLNMFWSVKEAQVPIEEAERDSSSNNSSPSSSYLQRINTHLQTLFHQKEITLRQLNSKLYDEEWLIEAIRCKQLLIKQ